MWPVHFSLHNELGKGEGLALDGSQVVDIWTAKGSLYARTERATWRIFRVPLLGGLLAVLWSRP